MTNASSARRCGGRAFHDRLGRASVQAAPDASHPAVQRALAHLGGGTLLTAQASVDDAFQATDLIIEADGTEHVRLQRSHKGLPVIAGDLVVRSDASGRFHSLSQTLSGPIALSIKPTVSATKAGPVALGHFGHRDGAVQGQRLVVYARDGAPRLAWDVRVHGVQSRRHAQRGPPHRRCPQQETAGPLGRHPHRRCPGQRQHACIPAPCRCTAR